MAYYVCGNPSCHFVFERSLEPDACPDCGKGFIREATGEEIAKYMKARSEEHAKEKPNT